MELDHIFIFAKEPDQVSKALHLFGLTEGTSNVHPGQGTACRRFFFHNAYLELVWVINEEEIKNSGIAKTKLWERAQHYLTHYCPFGLCFRNKHQMKNSVTLLFDDGWRYHSPYLPEGQFANIASNQNFPAEPMLFEMPFFGLAPKDYPLEKKQPLTHKKEFEVITKVTLTLPTTIKDLSTAMKKVISSSIVTVSEGEDYGVALEFDHGKKEETQDFTHLIPLTFKW
jgi:hypothetical protein